MYYKLGDGPINYEWNCRYFKIEATDLIYSPSDSFTEKKSVNIQGASVSQIAEIKLHPYAFCVIIPPPINKLIYISADRMEDATELRHKAIKATMNNNEENDDMNNSTMNDSDVKKGDVSFGFLSKEHHGNSNNDHLLYSSQDKAPDDIKGSLEEFKEKVLKNEKEYRMYYDNGIRAAIPKKALVNEMEMIIDVLWYMVMMIIISYGGNKVLKWILGWMNCYMIIMTQVILTVMSIAYKIPYLYSYIKFPSAKRNCDYFVKGTTIVDYNIKKVYDVISNWNIRKEWDYFMGNNDNKTSLSSVSNASKAEMILIPYINNNIFLRIIQYLYQILKGSKETVFIQSIERSTFYDDKKNYYIIFSQQMSKLNIALNDTNSNQFIEGFCLSAIDLNQTMIIFFTNIDFNKSMSIIHPIKDLSLPYYLRQILKHERIQILSTLKEFLKHYSHYGNSLINDDDDNNNEGIRPRKEIEDNYLDHLLDKKYKEYHKWFNKQYPINPTSILIDKKPISIEERFEGYLRNSEGGVECRNYAELRNYDGLMLDLMKRAGKMLLEGKNIIGLSLPSKVFEPKSTLIRLVDLWGTAPIYLNKAAECSPDNHIEIMKNVITFAIAGLHINIKQLKPYNPILGETYEGYWPDGSKIYLEHISHHPGLTRFYIIGPDSNWIFHGYYEYCARIKGIGNVACGQFKGINIVEFPKLNKRVEFHFPLQNISGMMYGKRIIEWEGEIKFLDTKEKISCCLTFTTARGFLQSFVEPTDIMRGVIKQNDKILCKVFGSPLDSLFFDGELYWELNKCDLFYSMKVDKCLMSDCRYRTDVIALGNGDVILADKEKQRLEGIQRNDKALRLKGNSHSQHVH